MGDDRAFYMKAWKIHWGNYGKNGIKDPVTSKSILIKWLVTDDESAKYRGGSGNGGTKKIELQAIIATLVNSKGVKVRHDANRVNNQVKHIKVQMKASMAWKDGPVTGA